MSNVNHAAGALFYSLSTKKFLFLLRGDASFSNKWGIVGGKRNKDETDIDTILREIKEEIGFLPYIRSIEEIDVYDSDDCKFHYSTYFVTVNDEFKPLLNHEHYGYAWVGFNCWPKPLHPGLLKTLNKNNIKEFIKNKTDII